MGGFNIRENFMFLLSNTCRITRVVLKGIRERRGPMPSEGLLHFSFMINSQVYMRDEEGPLGLDQLAGGSTDPRYGISIARKKY